MKGLFILLFSLVAISCRPASGDQQKELMRVEQEFAKAVLNNDPEAIGKFLSDDWVIVDADGGIIDKARFLDVIQSKKLIHDSMELDDMQVRVHGNTAIVTTVTSTEGKFMKQSFVTRERATDVFVRQNGRWICEFSQLTRFNPREKTSN